NERCVTYDVSKRKRGRDSNTGSNPVGATTLTGNPMGCSQPHGYEQGRRGPNIDPTPRIRLLSALGSASEGEASSFRCLCPCHSNTYIAIQFNLRIGWHGTVDARLRDQIHSPHRAPVPRAARGVLTNLGKYQDSKHLHFHVNAGEPLR